MATAPKPKLKSAPSKRTAADLQAAQKPGAKKTVDQKRRPDGTYPKGTKVPGYAAQKGKAPKGPVTNKFSPIRPAKPDKRVAGRGR